MVYVGDHERIYSLYWLTEKRLSPLYDCLIPALLQKAHREPEDVHLRCDFVTFFTSRVQEEIAKPVRYQVTFLCSNQAQPEL